jgi:hypothetical protein
MHNISLSREWSAHAQDRSLWSQFAAIAPLICSGCLLLPIHRACVRFQLVSGLARDMKAASLSTDRSKFPRVSPGALGRTCALLLCGLASCTGSPATLALQPAFEIMTPAGTTSVSIREAPAG